MPSCCIKNCKSYTAGYHAVPKNIKFHRFPKEITVRQKWLNACQRKESDIKVDAARICSIHFEENCFALGKTKPRLINDPVKEFLRLKKGSIPTKFLKLEKKRRRRMSRSKKDNKINIKVQGKSFLPTYTELVQYAQQEQRLPQEETVTKMEIDVAQNMEEAVIWTNMERDTLQDTKEKVTKNKDKVATQNMEEQNKAIKQHVKQGINDDTNVNVKTLSMQLRKSKELNRKLLYKINNLGGRIRDLNTQVAQLQAKIKNMTKNEHKEAKTIAINALREIIERLDSSEDIARIRDLSTQVAQLQAQLQEIKNMTKNKYEEAKTIAIDALRKIIERVDSSEDIARAARAVSLL